MSGDKKKILVFSESEELSARTDALLCERGFSVRLVSGLSEAEACSAETDAAVLFMPKPEEKFVRLAARMSVQSSAGIIAVVRAEYAPRAEESLDGLGVVLLTLPLNAKLFVQALDVAVKMSERLRAVNGERAKLESVIGDLKLIDRAKCTLVRYLNMTESDAHKFIEKQSMNRHLPKREIALEILKTYES